jgi:flagellar hook-associated protein 2
MASPLTSTGLGSGLDVNGMVTKLVAADRAAADKRLMTTDKDLTTEFSAISQLKGAMSGLQTSAAALTDSTSLVMRTATSADATIVGITSSSAAVPGSYDIQVLALATASKLSSSAFSSAVAGNGTPYNPGYNLGVQGTGVDGSNLTAGDLSIAVGSGSAVAVGVSVAGTAVGQTANSAYAKAAAINSAGITGLTATADTTVNFDWSDITENGYTLVINGSTIASAAHETEELTGTSIAASINAKSATSGVTATYDATNKRLQLQAADGRDISISQTVASGDAGAGLKTTSTGLGTLNNAVNDALNATTAAGATTTLTARGSVKLVSAQSITLAGNNVSRLGYSAGTVSMGNLRLGTGTLTLAQGSSSFSLTIDSTNNTLTGIRDAINKAGSNPGISATIVNGTDGAHLVLSGGATGAANAVRVTETGTVGLVAALSTTTAATDASLQVGGYTLSSASNTVTSAIDGVTLNLNKVSATGVATTVTVSNDSAGVQGKVQTFISNYNSLLSKMASLSGYVASTKTAGPLQGDPLVIGLQTQMRRLAQSVISSAGTTYDRLASVGITTAVDGSLALDASKFQAAQTANPSAMAALFSGTTGIATKFQSALDSHLTATTGDLDARNISITARRKDLTTAQTALNARMVDVQARYLKTFNALDQMLAKMQQTSGQLTSTLSKATA